MTADHLPVAPVPQERCRLQGIVERLEEVEDYKEKWEEKEEEKEKASQLSDQLGIIRRYFAANDKKYLMS